LSDDDTTRRSRMGTSRFAHAVVVMSKLVLWLLYAVVTVNNVLLFLAFFLQLFGANPDADFTAWVYRSVTRAMAPFRGIFEPVSLTDESVLDPSLLFAMIIYGVVSTLLGGALVWLNEWLEREDPQHEPVPRPSAVAPPGPPPTLVRDRTPLTTAPAAADPDDPPLR
jgi:hypothetical protein